MGQVLGKCLYILRAQQWIYIQLRGVSLINIET